MVLLAATILHFLLYRRYPDKVDIYVDNIKEAHFYRTDTPYDNGFTSKEKRRAFNRARVFKHVQVLVRFLPLARCATCRTLTIYGEAGSRYEHFLSWAFDAKEGQAHHIVPRKMNGRSMAENAAWLCARCNVRISDDWNKEAEEYCRQHRYRVYLPKRERRNPLRSWREIVGVNGKTSPQRHKERKEKRLLASRS